MKGKAEITKTLDRIHSRMAENSNLSFSQASDMDFCEDATNHTPHPPGYIGHMHWMDEMQKTHRQIKCRTCGRWAIWVPK